MPSGSSVAVIGAGGVGLNSVQGAALSWCTAGHWRSILVDAKLDAAREFGATHTPSIQSKKTRLQPPEQHTNGRGVDYVFVTAGSGKAIAQSLDMMRVGGTVVLVGLPASGTKAEIEATNFAVASQKVMGSKMGSTRLQIDVPKLVELYQQGRLKLDELVTKRYPLEQINEAIAEVKSGNALRNVIVFDN